MINQNREHVVFVPLFQVGAESFLMSDVDNENMLAGQTLTSRLLSQKSMIYKWDCLIICYLYKALKLKLVSTNKLFLEQSISDFCASIVNCLSLLQKIQDMKMGISNQHFRLLCLAQWIPVFALTAQFRCSHKQKW